MALPAMGPDCPARRRWRRYSAALASHSRSRNSRFPNSRAAKRWSASDAPRSAAATVALSLHLRGRGPGLLLGVELTDAALAERVIYNSLERGLSFKVTMGIVLTLTPPLTVARKEVDLAIAIIDQAPAAPWREFEEKAARKTLGAGAALWRVPC